LTVPADKIGEFQMLSVSAAMIGDAITELAQEAMMVGAPDPESFGVEGGDWPNIENLGVILQGWARIVASNLPATGPTGGLIVVENKLHRPAR
jgi:hypothetical protein